LTVTLVVFVDPAVALAFRMGPGDGMPPHEVLRQSAAAERRGH